MIKTKQFSQAIQSLIFDNVSVYFEPFSSHFLHRERN